ncbi:hypothetical protein [Companilactobacillus nantensis]|uniref:Uncharacterized protein n=1 Tax=Companilactobacillus nantensis DSM 16982 TaxID=1423774 RepID=A0A0R1WJN6_9LACO|nr:hypothetical protein [Companilactobacillus nantensis]KRM15931.1 hypothetical protein FD31_GL000830 [Companilactobacillus nantensis DSM 16982]GEO64800.1 hypothetical protein LNA01_19830 [Companilactobacillus nantensis]
MTYEEVSQLLKSPVKFKEYLIKLLKNTEPSKYIDCPEGTIGVPLVEYGSDDGYYWDKTIVSLNDDDSLEVTFDIGSGSGWIPMDFTEYRVTIEQFRQYLLNRKWADPNIDTVELLTESIKEIEGAKLIKREEDE